MGSSSPIVQNLGLSEGDWNYGEGHLVGAGVLKGEYVQRFGGHTAASRKTSQSRAREVIK